MSTHHVKTIVLKFHQKAVEKATKFVVSVRIGARM
jgi:hypothetical protein